MTNHRRPPMATRSLERARELRSGSTDAERKLWSVLRGGNIDGLKFRRQHSIPPYTVDFCCLSADLVVEVDVPVRAVPCSGSRSEPALWGMATVAVRMRRLLWIEDLIALIEEALASAENSLPSVEHACTVLGKALEQTDGLDWYKVLVKNMANDYASFAAYEWPEERPWSRPLPESTLFTGPQAAFNL